MTLRLVAAMISTASLTIAQGPLRFEPRQFERRTSQCVVTFEYPEITAAASPAARDRMNAGILRILLRGTQWPLPNSNFRSLDAYATSSIRACTEFQTRPEARALYEHKRVTLFRSTPPVLSFRCEANVDAGGVHPYGTTFFANFDAGTGKSIAITDLVKNGALPKLDSVAEAILRRDRGLSPTEPLSDNGYRFPGGRFRLNANFGIGEKQLVFVFNTYEIGPGAMGATEIAIPYQDIPGLLKLDLRP